MGNPTDESLTQEGADVVQSLWRAANAQPTRAELLHALARAYDAMRGEYMSCPWCTGHIGDDARPHDEFCIWPKLAPLVAHYDQP